jgi:hypothetical protein
MIEIEHIQTKLDALAEYQAQKDSIEARKRELLDEVKVPAEVIQVMNQGNKKSGEFEARKRKELDAINAEIEEQLSAIVVPEEIKAALAEIDHQRGLVETYRRVKQAEFQEAIFDNRNKIQTEIQMQTAQVYADIAQRKLEIEAEFAGKAAAVDENIAALEAEIKADVLKTGHTITGKYKQAVWNKGRVGTWNSGKLDGLALIMPAIAECRNPGGEPTVTFRSVK